jgi:hypothetical protein
MVDRYDRGRQIIHTFAELTRVEKAGVASGALILPGIQCPVCRRVVWQGVRRRSDAVYSSAARAKRRVSDGGNHDG